MLEEKSEIKSIFPASECIHCLFCYHRCYGLLSGSACWTDSVPWFEDRGLPKLQRSRKCHPFLYVGGTSTGKYCVLNFFILIHSCKKNWYQTFSWFVTCGKRLVSCMWKSHSINQLAIHVIWLTASYSGRTIAGK